MKPRSILAALALGSLAAPLAAESASTSFQPRGASATGDAFAQFAPASDRREHRIDYQHWDEALAWFVVPMGPSIRETPGRVEPELGTRRIYGHESRYRLEGNRVAFSYLTPGIREALTQYRQDLERVGSELDLTAIPRNEQLAFWLNLHNVAVIEALAGEYPLSEPSEREFGSNAAPLDDAKLVTIKGVELSPRDIRERIVYPNWQDPKVIYGFWRGVIGGPSIQRLAYTGSNVDALLSLAGEEFVNSLRGVEHYGGALRVSRIYEEAAPHYFGDFETLRGHLQQFAAEDVQKLLNKSARTGYNSFDGDLADLARGERDPALNFRFSQQDPAVGAGGLASGPNGLPAPPIRSRPNIAIQRLIAERQAKIGKAIKRGIRTGMVIYGDGDYSEGEAPKEVE
ncbi:MAG: DUF547 domain-containing protein [Erythrobacter sp.]|nr:DUF547 domain-containing protein [Erythrobacter sp.]